MISEFRRIVFPKNEILKAIASFHSKGGDELPPGEIVTVAFNCEPEPTLILKILDARSGETQDITLESTYLAAAMLSHCIDAKIPMPRQAKKSVEVAGETVSLILSLNATPDMEFKI